jgi:hypothetical protein
MTIADRQVQQDIEKFQREGVPVRVSRFLGVDLPERGRIVTARS